MTEADIQNHVKAALDEHLPKVIDEAYRKVCAEQSSVMVEEQRKNNKTHAAEMALEDARKERREGRLLKFVIAPIITVVLGGSGFGAWRSYATEGAVGKRVGELETVIVGCPNGDECKPEKRKESLTGRVHSNEKKIDRLGELHFQQLRVIVDQGEEQRLKLDAISPKAQEIEKPKSAEEAETAVAAHEKLKEEKEEKKRAEEAIKQGDPFAGIE